MKCVEAHTGWCAAILISLWGLLPVPSSWAWGPAGHRIVAHVAELRVDPAVLNVIRNEFNIKHLDDVANWADVIKKRPDAPDALHYTNIAEGSRTYDQNRDCPRKRCVTEKIKYYSGILKDVARPKSDRKEALKFIIHFVADAHQPMHMGNARDRGGNEIRVRTGEGETNLHALWDSGMIDLNGQSLIQYARTLNATIPLSETLKWAGGPDDWTNESRALVLDYGYPLLKDEQGRLSPRYLEQGRVVIKVQLMKGGVRLARLLNILLQPSLERTP